MSSTWNTVKEGVSSCFESTGDCCCSFWECLTDFWHSATEWLRDNVCTCCSDSDSIGPARSVTPRSRTITSKRTKKSTRKSRTNSSLKSTHKSTSKNPNPSHKCICKPQPQAQQQPNSQSQVQASPPQPSSSPTGQQPVVSPQGATWSPPSTNVTSPSAPSLLMKDFTAGLQHQHHHQQQHQHQQQLQQPQPQHQQHQQQQQQPQQLQQLTSPPSPPSQPQPIVPPNPQTSTTLPPPPAQPQSQPQTQPQTQLPPQSQPQPQIQLQSQPQPQHQPQAPVTHRSTERPVGQAQSLTTRSTAPMHHREPPKRYIEPPRIDFVETGSIFGDRKRVFDNNMLLLENGRFKSPGQPKITQGPGGRTIRLSFQTGFPSIKSVESRGSITPTNSKKSVDTVSEGQHEASKTITKHKWSLKSVRTIKSHDSRASEQQSNEDDDNQPRADINK